MHKPFMRVQYICLWGWVLPRKGYQAITVSEHVYDVLKKFIKNENRRAGYKKWRSISQFCEMCVMEHLREKVEELERENDREDKGTAR